MKTKEIRNDTQLMQYAISIIEELRDEKSGHVWTVRIQLGGMRARLDRLTYEEVTHLSGFLLNIQGIEVEVVKTKELQEREEEEKSGGD